MSSDSDLIGLPVTIAVIAGILAVLGAYFFIGAIVGTVLLIVLVVLAVVWVVGVIRRNELN